MTVLHIGSGAYCYANSLAMVLGPGAPSPAVIEVLTGSPFGAELIGGTAPFFNPLAWDPGIGLDTATGLLGWTCTCLTAGSEAEAAALLREARASRPLLACLMEIGLLLHHPDSGTAIGSDHYVVITPIQNDVVRFHDPHGYPHATLPTGDFITAWRADLIGYATAPFTARTSFRPVMTSMKLRSAPGPAAGGALARRGHRPASAAPVTRRGRRRSSDSPRSPKPWCPAVPVGDRRPSHRGPAAAPASTHVRTAAGQPSRRLSPVPGSSPVPGRGQVGPAGDHEPGNQRQDRRGGLARIMASTPRHSSAATAPRMSRRTGRPYRMRAGSCHVYAAISSPDPTVGSHGTSAPSGTTATGSGEVSLAAAYRATPRRRPGPGGWRSRWPARRRGPARRSGRGGSAGPARRTGSCSPGTSQAEDVIETGRHGPGRGHR